MRFTRILALAVSCISMAFVSARACLARMADVALSLFPAEPLRILTDSFALPLATTGHAVDASLLHSRRHESGVSRRSAARKR